MVGLVVESSGVHVAGDGNSFVDFLNLQDRVDHGALASPQGSCLPTSACPPGGNTQAVVPEPKRGKNIEARIAAGGLGPADVLVFSKTTVARAPRHRWRR